MPISFILSFITPPPSVRKRRYNGFVEIGTKVIIYTLVLRGSAQTSYVGMVIALSDTGVTIEGTTGKLFFPWSAIERVTF